MGSTLNRFMYERLLFIDSLSRIKDQVRDQAGLCCCEGLRRAIPFEATLKRLGDRLSEVRRNMYVNEGTEIPNVGIFVVFIHD